MLGRIGDSKIANFPENLNENQMNYSEVNWEQISLQQYNSIQEIRKSCDIMYQCYSKSNRE